MQESMSVAAEAPPIDVAAVGPPGAMDGPLADPRALQILSTEHWSLLASRSLSYNEAFSRAGMFLTFVSASLIVIGFLVGSNGLSVGIIPLATVLLFADFIIGLATVGRMIDASREELMCIRGMNRIRHAYLEMVPGIDAYFVSGFHDDDRGVLMTYVGSPPTSGILANVVHGLTTTIGMIATIDAMILGAIAALVAIGLGAAVPVAAVAGLGGFVAAFLFFVQVLMRTAVGEQRRLEARFPTPAGPVSDSRASAGRPTEEP